MPSLKVMIIGGGIGGLCLAHGLRRAGVPVTVHERTEARTDWLQGYRIHINPHGARALEACLPPEGWKTFLDTVPADRAGFGFTTEHLRDLLRFPATEVGDGHYGVSRIKLREVLLAGLGDDLRTGHEFVSYAVSGDTVTAHFADGSTDTADVLIGADGANSRVRAQLLPHAAGRVDTGIITIAGRHPLPAATLPRVLTDDVNLVIPARRGSFFTAIWPGDDPYVLWSFSDLASALPPPANVDLRRLVLERTTGWAPALRDLVAGSDTPNALRIRSAIPVKPWPTGRVTLLGDAIHNMTPMAGVGANTALRDAELLARALTRPDLLPALRDYETEMLGYGFAAVRRSLRNARQGASPNRLGRAAFRTMLRTVDALPPIRRRMGAQLGQ
ncbi:NAD(P)/FAD-dependent oxidoreductase [Actinoplanes sp. NPDC051470]|uniref:FAD-dependent oxidoreductase n=1 Tax=Actinoplanes sp. NPDC051470 TaxID=3157224 RepID=UPI003436B388